MLSEQQIEANRDALFETARHLNGPQIGGMVFHAKVPVCLFIGTDKIVDKQIYLVRFVHDKNWPKLQIDNLDSVNFHTEFSVAWQHMKFNAEKALLIVKGTSDRVPIGYKLHLHVRGKRAIA
ncbi:hypothetical protein H9L17_04790 [Thermomonas brevis]|uniref:Uncharacterized protein n=1 Tax=Thermomonas brevis TaxID=215691 RepID=A0A7G9QVT3_9GAMM|nr:hypothetical protein [Thermomonas brevis]QNN47458.1 hypothetical protein H9L17_04790 [Thermomonas brevis]